MSADPLVSFLSRPLGVDHWTLDLELVHQLVLKALIENIPSFGIELFGAPLDRPFCKLESRDRIFDLELLCGDKVVAVCEIKVLAPLELPQIHRQTERCGDARLRYLLLGWAAQKWSREKILTETRGKGQKISYSDLIKSIDALSGTDSLATAYRTALIAHREQRLRGSTDPDL